MISKKCSAFEYSSVPYCLKKILLNAASTGTLLDLVADLRAGVRVSQVITNPI